MILKGTLRRIGSQTSDDHANNAMASLNALEIGAHPELRNVRGSEYILDHLRSAIGQDVTVGLVGRMVVAVKKAGSTYQETGLKTSFGAHIVYWLVAILAALLSGGFLFFVPIIVYFWSKAQMQRVVAEVQAS